MTQPPNDRPDPGQWTAPPAASRTPSQPPHAQPYQQQPAEQLWTPQPPPPRRRRAPLIASLIAVVALAVGGTLTYVALSDSSTAGGATPKEAVQQIVQDLQNSDLVGLLDDLAPGERDALANPVREDIDKLKQLHVLNPAADPSKISGITFAAKNLTYGAKPTVVNDHVQIVQLTGGTLDVTGDATKLPFTDQIRSLQHGPPTATTHVDLADQAPVRIATVQVGGRWYPSLFYTVADAAAGHRIPRAGDSIPAMGSSSAEGAVRDELDALLTGDLRTALAHVSPSELGAVHDYGAMLLAQAPGWNATGVKISTLDLTTSPLSGGATRVGLAKLVLSSNGDQIGITIDGSCATITAAGQTKKFCATNVADQLGRFFGALTCYSRFGTSSNSSDGTSSNSSNCDRSPLSAAQRTALADLFSGFTRLGIATTEIGGKWYVDPVRTTADVWGTLLGGMKGNDLLELAKLGN